MVVSYVFMLYITDRTWNVCVLQLNLYCSMYEFRTLIKTNLYCALYFFGHPSMHDISFFFGTRFSNFRQ